MPRPRSPEASSTLLTLATLVTAVAALYFAKEILLPVALAILLSFLLTPPAERLERLGLNRLLSVLSVVAVAFAILGILGSVVTNELVSLSADLDGYRANLIKKVHAVVPRSSPFSDVTETIEDVSKELTGESKDRGEPKDEAAEKGGADKAPGSDLANRSPGAAEARETSGDWWTRLTGLQMSGTRGRPVDVRLVETPSSPLKQVFYWLGPLVSPLMTAGIVVVLVIFMLIGREDQRNRLIQLFGVAHLHATTEAITDVTERVSRYLRMQFLINAGYGLLVGAGLTLMGVPNGVMWGALSFSLRFLPYIGPWLSAIMPLFISIASSDGWTQPLLVVCWFSILELLVNTVAEPLLYGRSTGVSGVGVIVAAIFWTWIWGPIGLVLAMPLTVCLVVMSQYIPALHFLTVLLGDQPTLAPHERIYQRLLAGDGDEAQDLMLEELKSRPLSEAYDVTVIPALRMAERDRHAGLLHEDQEELVHATARDLIEEIGEATDELRPKDKQSSEPAEVSGQPRLWVLCIPLRDEADETSGIMLAQLLIDEGMDAEVAPVEFLTSEAVDLVGKLKSNVVVISMVPPHPPRNSRLLCRRLRERYPELPIVLGYWSGLSDKDHERRLADVGDAELCTTLAAAVERIRAIAGRPQTAPAEAAS